MSGAEQSLPPLREVIKAHDLRAKKSLGQNFLLDLNLTAKIARAAGPLENTTILEVGPGPGGLTRALLSEGAARVIAIEMDRRCLAPLADVARAFDGRLHVEEGDALGIDEPALLARLGVTGDVRVAANLPYNVGTALLVKWLTLPHWPPWYQSLTLMFQREVAERLVAAPSTAAYGRLSVLVQWRAQARLLFNLPPEAFTPPPSVTSTVVRLEPRGDAAPVDPALMGKITAAAFGQRRKMLRQSLKTLGVPVDALLSGAGIDPTLRAENLDVAAYVALARSFAACSNGQIGQ